MARCTNADLLVCRRTCITLIDLRLVNRRQGRTTQHLGIADTTDRGTSQWNQRDSSAHAYLPSLLQRGCTDRDAFYQLAAGTQVKRGIKLLGIGPSVRIRGVLDLTIVDRNTITQRQSSHLSSRIADGGLGIALQHIDRQQAGYCCIAAAGNHTCGGVDDIAVEGGDRNVVLRQYASTTIDQRARAGIQDTGRDSAAGRDRSGEPTRNGNRIDFGIRLRLNRQIVQCETTVRMATRNPCLNVVIDTVDRCSNPRSNTARRRDTTGERVDTGGVTRLNQHLIRLTAAVQNACVCACINVVTRVGERRSARTCCGATEGKRINISLGKRLNSGIGTSCQLQTAVADPRLTHLCNRADRYRTSTRTSTRSLHVAGQGLDIDLALGDLDVQFASTLDFTAFDASRLFAVDHVDCNRCSDRGCTGPAAAQCCRANQRIAAAGHIQQAGYRNQRVLDLRHPLGENNVIDVGRTNRRSASAIDHRAQAPDSARAFGSRERQTADIRQFASENLCTLLTVQDISGSRSVNGYRTGTATSDGDRIDRLLHATFQTGIGKAIDQTSALNQSAAICRNAVDRCSKPDGSRSATGH